MLEHWPADDHVEMRVGKAERVNVVRPSMTRRDDLGQR
jgi:hypothetical protein